MRSLERNKKPYYYALYEGEVDVIDEDGNFTGEKTVSYSNPVEFKINVSANKGEASVEPFGVNLDYDKIMSTCDILLPIDETSILFIDVEPVLDENGATTTQHDYSIKKVAKSLNSVQYAIKKV